MAGKVGYQVKYIQVAKLHGKRWVGLGCIEQVGGAI